MLDYTGVRLEKIKKVGKFAVWIVDGALIRRDLDPQFTNFGQHYRFKFIPEREFWIDKESASDERRFFINHLVIENHLMKHGLTYTEAITVADMREQAERNRCKKIRDILANCKFLPPNSVHEKLIGRTQKGVSVWIVDGKMVRSAYYIDFTAGGHDQVYDFVPKKEVWLDDDMALGEVDYVLLHELFERKLMKRGMTYDDAHERASAVELKCREHPEKMKGYLSRLGWIPVMPVTPVAQPKPEPKIQPSPAPVPPMVEKIQPADLPAERQDKPLEPVPPKVG